MFFNKIKILSIITLSLVMCLLIPNSVDALNRKSVFIDAGHGGNDNGSSRNSYKEDNINLQIANIVVQKLKARGIDVSISRDSDVYVSLSERAEMANKSGADLFVSIHQNAALNTNARGVETFYMGDDKNLAKIMQSNVVQYTGANDRGAKYGNLQVLRDNNLPAVLVECGFISNPNEVYRLSTSDYQEKVANGIVQGILEYLSSNYKKPVQEQSNVTEKPSIVEEESTTLKTALNSVSVMSDRDKNSKVIGTLPKGQKVTVLDSKFDWLKINFNGKTGYVSSVYVK